MRTAMVRNALVLASMVVSITLLKVAVAVIPALILAIHGTHEPTLASSTVR